MSTVVPFKRPQPNRPQAKDPPRRSVAEFAVAMLMMGLIFYLLPTLWSGAPLTLLAVVNLLVAVVYVTHGPKYLAIGWIVLSLVVLALFEAPSPVSFALSWAVREFGF